MFVSLRSITLSSDPAAGVNAARALRRAGVQIPGVSASWAAVVTPAAALDAVHIAWRMSFESEQAALAAPLTTVWRAQVAPLLAGGLVSGVGYHMTRRGGDWEGGGLWRALVFQVAPHGFPEGAARLETLLLLFPKYIPAIRSWALNRVSGVEGANAYTHVWEQKYDGPDGLIAYRDAPIHWGVVGPYFDPENPECIVEPQVMQLVGEIGEPLIA